MPRSDSRRCAMPSRGAMTCSTALSKHSFRSCQSFPPDSRSKRPSGWRGRVGESSRRAVVETSTRRDAGKSVRGATRKLFPCHPITPSPQQPRLWISSTRLLPRASSATRGILVSSQATPCSRRFASSGASGWQRVAGTYRSGSDTPIGPWRLPSRRDPRSWNRTRPSGLRCWSANTPACAAMTWLAEQQDGERLARMAGALWPFWEEHAHYPEGRHWLEAALDLGHAAPAGDRLRLLTGAGTMAWRQTDFAQAIFHHEQALTLAREMGDREAEAFALNNLGAQAMELGHFDDARTRYQATIAIAREAGTVHLVILALHNLGEIQRMQHDSTAALQSKEEALALARQHAMSWGLPSILTGLGLIATDLGDYDRAIALFHESLALA